MSISNRKNTSRSGSYPQSLNAFQDTMDNSLDPLMTGRIQVDSEAIQEIIPVL